MSIESVYLIALKRQQVIDIKMIRSLSVAAITNIGLNRRCNEDSMFVGNKVFAGVSMDTPITENFTNFPVLFSVADGIGGSVAGDLASQTVMRCFSQEPVPHNEEELRFRILSAERDLDNLVSLNPQLYGLGTTIAGVLYNKSDLVIFSCGDSRVYIYNKRQRSPELITHDHSVIQEMIDAGKLDEEEARLHPLGHIITSCLSGGGPAINPDIRVYHKKPDDDDRLIICTDGVWDYGGEKFLKAVCNFEAPEAAALQVYKVCMDIGAPDNFTLIIIDLSKDNKS